MRETIVATGLGAITPLGLDVPSTWQAVTEGRSGVGRITLFDPSDIKAQIAAEVKNYNPTDYFPAKEARRYDRYIQFALIAADEAMKDSGLEITSENADRIGVISGTGIGGIGTLVKENDLMREKGPTRVSPFFIPMILADTAPGLIAIKHGAKGPNMVITSACASSANAIGEALRIIRSGDADAIIVGGSEASVFLLALAGFSTMQATSRRNSDPERACRPFDADRDGFLPGEGAAFMVIERLSHAKARGANIYGEIAGYGATADAFHITAPASDGEGAARAMKHALDDAGISPSDVDYVNAHGTSTPLNDPMETKAIKIVFGDRAYQIPISATKSMMGHLLGAAGAAEAIVSLKTIETGVITPTINYETPDPECDLDYVPNTAREADVRVVLSNSFGFGGHNASLVFRTCSGQ